MQSLTPRLSATSRASVTRSEACASPSGWVTNSRWPRGGSPRSASTLLIPASQMTPSCSSSSLREAPTQGPTRAPGHADERGPERAQGAERFEQRGHPRIVPRREEFEREDRLSALRREAEHVRDPHRRGFSSAGASLSAGAPLSADARRRLRRRLRRESSWPVPGAAAGTTFAARTDAAQPGTLQGVEQSASVKASITLPAMSFTLPLVWHPHTCT